MGAEAFKGQVLRGKPSNNRHKSLTQMHQIASEYKSEKELKGKIREFVEKRVNKYMTKEKFLWFDEHFRIEADKKEAYLSSLTNLVYEQMQDNITITSDEQLKEQVVLLAGQVTEQNKIIEENKEKSIEVLREKEQLEKELDDLKETQAEQDNEITYLKNRLKAYTNQQTKIDEQNALMKNKDIENQSLTRKTESLQKENSKLKDSNNKHIGLLLEIASTNPELRDMIANEIPELRSKFIKDDAGMEMG
ncbi:hypothetical protein B9N66_06975 [Campylobacter concisus]|uniref:hypothetical protein n=1 Tax=Campylobacter concisus TaxID=199 RepID=UPI000B3D738D|nr:hypothetical protein [Campylobacter concisus]OUT08674.1 hypothetical protein B9N66_06975 [Campylobacter concisus]